MRCHHPEPFPLLAEVPETKTETVSTKLSELPQTTTYHTITYKAHTGPCPLHRTEVRLTGALPPTSDRSPKLTGTSDRSPKLTGTFVPYIEPSPKLTRTSDRSPKLTETSDRSPKLTGTYVPYIGPKSEADWDLCPLHRTEVRS